MDVICHHRFDIPCCCSCIKRIFGTSLILEEFSSSLHVVLETSEHKEPPKKCLASSSAPGSSQEADYTEVQADMGWLMAHPVLPASHFSAGVLDFFRAPVPASEESSVFALRRHTSGLMIAAMPGLCESGSLLLRQPVHASLNTRTSTSSCSCIVAAQLQFPSVSPHVLLLE